MFYKMNRFFLFSLLLLISEALMSAPIAPPPPPAPPGTPIHGILYAVALAIGYGIYAVKEKNKK